MSTVSHVTYPCKPGKPIRHWVLDKIDGISRHGLSIGMGKAATLYWLSPVVADFGRGFKLEKFSTHGGETYHVNLNGAQSTCECLGFLRWGTPCKHISTLFEAVADGLL